MVLQHLTSRLYLIAITWLSAWPMHVIKTGDQRTLDILLTEVPDLVLVVIVTHIANSDHSSICVAGYFDGTGSSKLVC